MYRLLFEHLLSRLDAERMHQLGFGLLRLLMALPFARRLSRALLVAREPVLELKAFGRTLDSPLGLAAGFDKDAVGYEALYALGFGFVEIGTLTGQAQPGNPKPRMFRLVQDGALINRLGFNNRGSEAAIPRLARARSLPLGVNIGKTKLVPEEQAAEDYALSAERLRPRHEAWFASAESEEERLRIERIAATPAEAMRAVLEAVDEQYGGAERYLLDGGLSPEALEAARARLR